MDDKWFNVVVGVGSTVFGTLFGFAVAEASALLKSRRVEKARNANARLMLGLEIDQNLSALRTIYDDLAEQPREGQQPVARAPRAALIVTMSEPAFSTQVRDGQLQSMPDVLGPEEIRRVHEFYYDLRRITAHRENLIALHNEHADDRRVATGGTGVMVRSPASSLGRRYKSTSPDLADVFFDLVAKLIAVGNPIPLQQAAAAVSSVTPAPSTSPGPP
jgi:hypothetical protein